MFVHVMIVARSHDLTVFYWITEANLLKREILSDPPVQNLFRGVLERNIKVNDNALRLFGLLLFPIYERCLLPLFLLCYLNVAK